MAFNDLVPKLALVRKSDVGKPQGAVLNHQQQFALCNAIPDDE
jgi:hypothetical protein